MTNTVRPWSTHQLMKDFSGVEIEDVELVDPGRHDQQRPLQHRLGRRRVLDELHQIVLEDHLAGRDREVAADLELRRVGLADLQVAAAGLDVLGQHVHAAHEVLGVRASVSRSSSGLVSTKFDGESALAICRT